MRILHISHQYPPDRRGGVEVYTQTLAAHQASHGHTVAVLHGWSEGVSEPPITLRANRLPDGVALFAPSARPARHPLEFFVRSFHNPPLDAAFAVLLDTQPPDVVHVQHLKGLSARLVAVAKARGIPVVWTLHDWWAFCGNAQLVRHTGALCDGPRLWLNCADCAAHHGGVALDPLQGGIAVAATPVVAGLFAYRARLLTAALRQADALIAPTPFVRDRFIQQGTPAGGIHVVEHGIAYGPRPSRRAHPRPRIGYVGGLAWQKGVDVLIEAFNRLPDDAADLVIYGDPRPFPDYARRLTSLARHPRIRFLGPFAAERRTELMADLDLVVVPSVWPETSNLVVQEAFAAGTPVVASRLGALADRVRDGVDGRLVARGDADALAVVLHDLTSDPLALVRLREGVRPPRSLDDHAAAVEGVYRAVGGRL